MKHLRLCFQKILICLIAALILVWIAAVAIQMVTRASGQKRADKVRLEMKKQISRLLDEDWHLYPTVRDVLMSNREGTTPPEIKALAEKLDDYQEKVTNTSIAIIFVSICLANRRSIQLSIIGG